MEINELVEKAHANAVSHGWWEQDENGRTKSKPPLEIHMLIVSEVAEATEEVRNHRPPVYLHCKYEKSDGFLIDRHSELWTADRKPEGEAIELADAVIRIADYFGQRGWDLDEAIRLKMSYNATRPHRHGNKQY